VKIVLCPLRVLTQAPKLPVCRIQQRLESPSDCLELVRTKQGDRAHSEDRSTKIASQVKVLSLSRIISGCGLGLLPDLYLSLASPGSVHLKLDSVQRLSSPSTTAELSYSPLSDVV
jgi:hypothetical protein